MTDGKVDAKANMKADMKVSLAGFISGMIKGVDKSGTIVAVMFMSAGIYALANSPSGVPGVMVVVAGCGSILYSLMHIAVWKD